MHETKLIIRITEVLYLSLTMLMTIWKSEKSFKAFSLKQLGTQYVGKQKVVGKEGGRLYLKGQD